MFSDHPIVWSDLARLQETSLQDKVCLVTGAARGIGRGIALQLGGAGATVYITGKTLADLEDCAKEIKARGGTAVAVQMDHS